MTFRGKQWQRNGNHYALVGTKVRVYQWNSGANANFMVELLGTKPWEQNTWTMMAKDHKQEIELFKKLWNSRKEVKNK